MPDRFIHSMRPGQEVLQRPMPRLTVNIAVIHDGNILLTKREDFEVWCLPGGNVEEGESLAEAAVRETKEETGLDVELTSLVGVYSRIGGGLPEVHAVLYRAIPSGGQLETQPNETIDVAYFPYVHLPRDIWYGHETRIRDAIDNARGVSVRQEIMLRDSRQYTSDELYETRDQSGLTRRQFYLRHVEQARTSEVVEVGNRAQTQPHARRGSEGP